MSLVDDAAMVRNLDRVKEMGYLSRDLLLKGDLKQFGLLMDDHWRNKLKRSPNMCPLKVRDAYESAIKNNGAVGGKLVGAGGGGFLMFLSSDKQALRQTMSEFNFQELNFSFDKLGAHVLQAD